MNFKHFLLLHAPSSLNRIAFKMWGKSCPYFAVNDIHKAIFTHIPKCAGNSIQMALFSEKVSHNYLWLYKVYDRKRFRNYFKFTFVRNPYDRMVSAFFFMKNGGMHCEDQLWADKYLWNFQTFNDFITKMDQSPEFFKLIMSQQHFQQQYLFVTDYRKRLLVDYIGRFESLNKDFKHITEYLNIKAKKLNHTNKGKHLDWHEYCTKSIKDKIYEYYRQDFELFGYDR